MKRFKNTYLFLLIFMFLAICCNKNESNDVIDFVLEYIKMTSLEHAKYKKNITETMKNYYIDHKGKKTDMPELMLPGTFRNNIIIVKNYEILYIKKIDIDEYKKCYEVKVLFTIEDNKDKDVPYQKETLYWVCLHKHKFYIYADDFVKDIFILEKDSQLMAQ